MKRIIGKIDPSDKNVTIWGAGFSGLVLGNYLKNQGYKVTIYERSDRSGGKIHTKRTTAGLIETGANALYMNADGMDLLKELKLEPLPAAKKLRRYLLINGKLKRPLQLRLIAKLLFNCYKKPPLVTDGLTVADFFRPLIGTKDLDSFVSPILGGIYAARAEQLHFKSIFHDVPHIAQFASYWKFFRLMMKNQKTKPRLEVSGSVSFEGGMQSLINRLQYRLKQEIKFNYREKFKIKGNTIICTDAANASKLLSEVKLDFASELASIKYLELSSSTVFMKREIKALNKSFGALIPLNNGFNSIGVINNKAIFPSNHPNISSYTFISKKKCSKEEILDDIKSLYSDFVHDDVEHLELTHWESALPLYDLHRYLSIKKLHQMALKEKQFAIFGNYVAGISLREMISAARDFAKNPQHYEEFQ